MKKYTASVHHYMSHFDPTRVFKNTIIEYELKKISGMWSVAKQEFSIGGGIQITVNSYRIFRCS